MKIPAWLVALGLASSAAAVGVGIMALYANLFESPIEAFPTKTRTDQSGEEPPWERVHIRGNICTAEPSPYGKSSDELCRRAQELMVPSPLFDAPPDPHNSHRMVIVHDRENRSLITEADEHDRQTLPISTETLIPRRCSVPDGRGGKVETPCVYFRRIRII